MTPSVISCPTRVVGKRGRSQTCTRYVSCMYKTYAKVRGRYVQGAALRRREEGTARYDRKGAYAQQGGQQASCSRHTEMQSLLCQALSTRAFRGRKDWLSCQWVASSTPIQAREDTRNGTALVGAQTECTGTEEEEVGSKVEKKKSEKAKRSKRKAQQRAPVKGKGDAVHREGYMVQDSIRHRSM